ncbi:MAG: glycosyltransferase family 39 protein [Halanaerobiales bacterium]|nr:glycosyltransferase family 39 protein [Halanaerobiales bacterium]
MLKVDAYKNWQVILLILIILLPLYTINLGVNSLWDLDEGVYSEMSREMLLRNDYINTYYNYSPRFDKPPLVLWVTAFFYSLLGVSELTTRIGLVIFSMLNLVVLYYLAEMLFNRRTAIISTLILGTSFQYVIQSRILYMDVPLTLFITLSVLLFYIGYNKDRRYYLLMGIVLALGTLVKGPVAFGLPGLIALFYVGIINLFKEFKSKWTWLSVLVYLIFALPWHITVYLSHGNEFLRDYFGYHMLTRFSTAIETHGGPWYYYILILFLGLFPWSSFVPWLFPMIKRTWENNKDKYRLIISWITVIFVFFSIASTKLPGYILPTYPAFAILIGLWWDRLLKTGEGIRKFLVSNIVIILIGLLMLVGLYYIRPMVENELNEYLEVLDILIYFPIIFIAGGILSFIVYIWKEKKIRSFITYLGIAYIAITVIISLVLPLADQFKPAKTLANSLPENLSEEVKVVSALDMEPASIVFYSKRKVNYITNKNELREFLNANDQVYVYMDREDYLDVKDYVELIVIVNEYKDMMVIKNF